MYTLFRSCLHLTTPIQSPYTKLALISQTYFFESPNFNISEETRMNASMTPNPTETKPFNFVTEIFHSTLGFLHYGYMSSIRFYGDTIKHVEELESHLQKMEQDKSTWGANAFRFESMTNKYKVIFFTLFEFIFSWRWINLLVKSLQWNVHYSVLNL